MALMPSVRTTVAILAVLGFNLVMVVLAAAGGGPIDAPFVVVWIVGDSTLCLVALAMTERCGID